MCLGNIKDWTQLSVDDILILLDSGKLHARNEGNEKE